MNTDNLNGILPSTIVSDIGYVETKFGINTVLRLAHFLAQCAEESQDFTRLSENLNYSADGLLKVFPTHFDVNDANAYAHQPEKIANRIYADRMGNGDEQSGDGWKYRGRGLIEMTGKYMYQQFSNFIGTDCVGEPDLLVSRYALASAAYFFYHNGILPICDEGSSQEVVEAVTKKVNGGVLGLAQRTQYFEKIYEALNK